MDDATNPRTRELLVEQTDWLRALARRLVRDADLADDLAQDTLVVALEHPPAPGSNPRGWLRRVLKNLKADRLRSGEARRRRETAHARAERQPGTDELLERVQTGRRVAGFVLELEEPYRSAVLMRFYENLPPRRIAARQGVSVATVKSRITRGLGKLRERMDRDFGGGRQAWAIALAPWALGARDAQLLGATTIGGIALNTKAVWIAASIVAGTGAWLLLNETGGGAARAESPALTAAPAEAPAQSSELASRPPAARVDTDDGARRALTVPGEAATATGTEAELYAVRGRVLDGAGRAAVGVPVRLAGQDQLALSDGAGGFELSTAEERTTIEVAGDDWVAVRTGSWSLGSRLEPVLVVARSIDLGGRTIDSWGRSLENVRVTLLLPDDFESRFDRPLDASFQQSWVASTSTEGDFSLTAVPAVSGSRIMAAHPQYEPAVISAPDRDDQELWIELGTQPLQEGRALNGVVRRPDGTPAPDALVTMGLTTVPVDERGSFTIDLGHAVDTAELRAVETGLRPTRLARDHRPDADSTGWPDFVEVVLGGPSLSIFGRVVDEQGRPRAGGRVWIADATPFGLVGAVPLRLEALMAGGAVPSEAIDSMASEQADFGSAGPIYEPNGLLWWVETDADGRFELPGLDEREYTLNVLDRDLHWGATEGPVAAGERDLVITIPGEVAYPRLAGRVLTEQGDPISGVVVTPWVAAFEADEATATGTSHVTRFFLGEGARTDANGNFELTGVPRRHVQFHIISDAIVPSYASVEQVHDPEAFDIRVLARVHLEVEVAPGPDAPDHFRVVNASGGALTVLEMRADGYSNHDSFPLVDGRSGVVTITSDATALELLRDGAVVESIAITPRPGTPLSIRR